MDNQIIFIEANTIKSFNDETGEIGEYSVVFGNEKSKDFHGNWFTKSTFLGHNNGDGAVAFINHRVPLFKKGQFDEKTEKALKAISDMRMKNPVHTTVDDVGVFSKLALDLSDKYEKMVFELAKQGVFKWSSGTGPQGYKALPSGELEMFVIFEKSLTPMPAEYRMLEHRVMPLKSYTDILQYENPKSSIASFMRAYHENPFLEAMKGGKGSGFFGHAGRDAENLRGGSVARQFSRNSEHQLKAEDILTDEQKKRFTEAGFEVRQFQNAIDSTVRRVKRDISDGNFKPYSLGTQQEKSKLAGHIHEVMNSEIWNQFGAKGMVALSTRVKDEQSNYVIDWFRFYKP